MDDLQDSYRNEECTYCLTNEHILAKHLGDGSYLFRPAVGALHDAQTMHPWRVHLLKTTF